MTSKPTETLLLGKLSAIEANTRTLSDGLGRVNDNLTKIILGLMGIIGSQIAIKTIGSPWYVDISAAALGFGIVYFSGYVIWRWRIFPLELKVFVFAALGFCVYNLLDVIDAVPEWPGAVFHATVIGLGVFVLWKFEKYYHLPRGQRKA